MVAAGRNVKEISVAAGHSSVAFTLDRYGHLYESDEVGIQDVLDPCSMRVRLGR